MIERDFLIIGAGVAGASVCEGIREYNKSASITLIGNESYVPYRRTEMSRAGLLEKSVTPEAFYLHKPDWYEKNKIELRLFTVVTAFNLERRAAVLATGQTIQFNKACLATGSRAYRPQIGGSTLGNVFYLRSLRDLFAIRETAPKAENVVVIGGTPLAFEIAVALKELKCKVTLLNRDQFLLQNIVDPETGQWLTDYMRGLGIQLMLNESLNGFEGKTVLRNIQTKSGHRFPAAMAVTAVGEELNVELVRNTPLSSGNGTPVNETLETEEKGIYAVGDIALYPDKKFGGVRRVSNPEIGRAQGLLAGANMTGKRRQKFECIPWSSAEIANLRLEFIGDFTRPPVRYEFSGDRDKASFTVKYFQGPALVGLLLCNRSAAEVQELREEFRPGK